MLSSRIKIEFGDNEHSLGTCPDWSVLKRGEEGQPEMIEGELPEEIARQMVADYAAEGETVWMERTAPAPE